LRWWERKLGALRSKNPAWAGGIRNLGAVVEPAGIARYRPSDTDSRSILDDPFPNAWAVCSTAPMKPARAVLAPIVLLALTATVPMLAACGSANQQTHDGTTVTVEKPADSTAPAPSPSPAPSK
jgi:hypothetical protein